MVPMPCGSDVIFQLAEQLESDPNFFEQLESDPNFFRQEIHFNLPNMVGRPA